MKKKVISCLLVCSLLFINVFQVINVFSVYAYDSIVGEPQVGSNEYNEWKQQYVDSKNISLLNSINAYAASVSGNKLYNDFIELAVSSNARYTVGTSGGNPDITSDNNKKLLFGHASPSTSYSTIRIDGANYIYGNGTFTANPTFDTQANSNTSEQKIGNIRVKQVLSIVQNSATLRDDIVEIKYILTNEGSTTSNAGVRIMMDTMLGNNDAAPFRIPGIGAVTTEKEFVGSSIPQYWQAFDNLSSPSIVSQGTLYKSNIKKPDKVQFTNWRRVYDKPWGYTANTSYSNGDSAVSVIWEPKDLEPGQQIQYSTYYGLSEIVQDLRPPLALSLFGDSVVNLTGDNEYTPNPFVVTAYAQNIGNAGAKNVVASINLPEGLHLSQGESSFKSLPDLNLLQEEQVSWTVYVDPSYKNKTLEYSVSIWADQTESKTIYKKITVPALNEKKAIIFIHGVMGSELYTNDSFSSNGYSYSPDYRLWVPASSEDTNFIGYPNDVTKVRTDVRMLSCNDNGESIRDVKAVDLDENDNEYGADKTYSDIVNRLKNEFIPKGYTVAFFPYDWRLDNTKAAEKLAKFIDDNGINKVTLVAHSMGGIVASKYIEKSEDNKNKVEKLITLGTPYLGSPKITYMMEVGKLFAEWLSIPNTVRNSILAPAVKDILPNIESAYQLMPSSSYFDYNNTYYIQKFIDVPWYSWGKSDEKINLKTFAKTKELLRDRSWAKNANNQEKRFINDAENFQDSLAENNDYVINDVDSYVVIGYGYDTIAKIQETYDEDGNFVELGDTWVINGGDGTVPVISANIGSKTNDDTTYYVKEEHTGLVSNKSVLDLVVNIINGQPNKFDSKISKSLPEPGLFGWGKIKLKVECPVNLKVFDQNDNLISTVTDEYVTNEQTDYGSFYHLGKDNHIKIAYLNEENYKVRLDGTDNGNMTYTVQKYGQGENPLKTFRFENVLITPQTIINTDTNINETIQLNVDENGDGQVDKIISPDSILDEAGSNDETPPTITNNINGELGDNGWYKSNVIVKPEASDDISGINRIEYILNDSNPLRCEENININSEGINKILTAAFDNNLNHSNALEEIKIDKTAPEIKVSNIPSEIMLGTKLNVTFDALDGTSGLASVTATINDLPYTSGKDIEITKPGENVIEINAKDNAGNVISKIIKYYAYIPASITMYPKSVYVKKFLNKKVLMAAINLPSNFNTQDISLDTVIINNKYKALSTIKNKNIDFNYTIEEFLSFKLNRFKNITDFINQTTTKYDEKCLIDIDGDGKKELMAVFVIPDISAMVINNAIPIHLEGKINSTTFKADSSINIIKLF